MNESQFETGKEREEAFWGLEVSYLHVAGDRYSWKSADGFTYLINSGVDPYEEQIASYDNNGNLRFVRDPEYFSNDGISINPGRWEIVKQKTFTMELIRANPPQWLRPVPTELLESEVIGYLIDEPERKLKKYHHAFGGAFTELDTPDINEISKILEDLRQDLYAQT